MLIITQECGNVKYQSPVGMMRVTAFLVPPLGRAFRAGYGVLLLVLLGAFLHTAKRLIATPS